MILVRSSGMAGCWKKVSVGAACLACMYPLSIFILTESSENYQLTKQTWFLHFGILLQKVKMLQFKIKYFWNVQTNPFHMKTTPLLGTVA